MTILAPHPPPYPHPLDPRHKGFALHTTWHRCSRSAILLAGQVRAIGGTPANHFGHPRAVHDELRPTVCGSVHDDAAIAQHERSPGAWLSSLARAAMEMSSARRVSVGPCGCCGIVWFCQVGARTCCLRSHQARPEDREALIASPLSSLSTRRSHFNTGDLSVWDQPNVAQHLHEYKHPKSTLP